MTRENFKYNVIAQQNKTAGIFAYWVISQIRLAKYKQVLNQANDEVKTLRGEITKTQEEELQKLHSNKSLFNSTNKENQTPATQKNATNDTASTDANKNKKTKQNKEGD